MTFKTFSLMLTGGLVALGIAAIALTGHIGRAGAEPPRPGQTCCVTEVEWQLPGAVRPDLRIVPGGVGVGVTNSGFMLPGYPSGTLYASVWVQNVQSVTTATGFAVAVAVDGLVFSVQTPALAANDQRIVYIALPAVSKTNASHTAVATVDALSTVQEWNEVNNSATKQFTY